MFTNNITYKIKMLRMRIIFNISMFLTVLIVFFYIFSIFDSGKSYIGKFPPTMKLVQNNAKIEEKVIKLDYDYNLWLIFTKVIDKSPLMYNFKNIVTNLLNVSSVPLRFNIIVDDRSKALALNVINTVSEKTKKEIHYIFHNVTEFAMGIQDIVDAMTPFFSSRPGTYYSDALFYLSLGLYRLAPKDQKRAVMLDCDLYFMDDIVELFRQFKSFKKDNLFGLSPELSPVYKHILYNYKQKHNTTFGNSYNPNSTQGSVHPHGFQGYNSGVILFNLSAIRSSQKYKEVIKKESIQKMVDKYKFRGHLGDQDFYTLLGYEHPEMVHTLNCGFNRQLCTWWRDNGGYKDIFDDYFKCKHKVVVLHGNCNTNIP